MRFLIDWEDVVVHLDVYDTLPDAVAFRAAAYWTGRLHEALKQCYRPVRVQSLVYADRPIFNFIPRRASVRR